MKRSEQQHVAADPRPFWQRQADELVAEGRCPECAMFVDRPPCRARCVVIVDDHAQEAAESWRSVVAISELPCTEERRARRAEAVRQDTVHVVIHLLAWALHSPEELRVGPVRSIDARGQVSLWSGL